MRADWETFFKPHRPLVMGVLNLTPDSFHAASRSDPAHPDAAARRAQALCADGADIIDLGAESTRPGAAPIGEAEELARLIPAMRSVRAAVTVPISVDTWRPSVAQAALEAGADIINDIRGGSAHGDAMFRVAAAAGAPLVLMHMQNDPETMQDAPRYGNVVAEVEAWLAGRIAAARAAGVRWLLADPGIGFGKDLDHNLALLAALGGMEQRLGCPVLLGHSRKSFIGRILAETGLDGESSPRPVEERLAGSLAVAAWAAMHGVAVIRAHDVRETADTIRVLAAIRSAVEANRV